MTDEECEDCGWMDCEGDCVDEEPDGAVCPCGCGLDEPDDDAGHGDDWPGVETTTAFQEAGLL